VNGQHRIDVKAAADGILQGIPLGHRAQSSPFVARTEHKTNAGLQFSLLQVGTMCG
jgi:hypothetical protein